MKKLAEMGIDTKEESEAPQKQKWTDMNMLVKEMKEIVV
jgi:hypothetical protein